MSTVHTYDLIELNGEQFWSCLQCGRQMIVMWDGHDMDVRRRLVRGDDTVSHVGSIGGITVGVPSVEVVP
jgi:hypothetical protein